MRLVLLVLLVLTACALPNGGPAPKLFVLHAPAGEPSSAIPLPLTLKVAMPTAGAGLTTERIAVRTGAHTLDYYAGSRWAEPLPKLMQSLLIESFERSAMLKTVTDDTAGIRSEYVLRVDIRGFQANRADAAPHAQVRLAATLVREADHEALATFIVREEALAADNRMEAIAEAFDTAFGKAVQGVVAKTVEALAAAK